jgi:two-component system NarL family response regulator
LQHSATQPQQREITCLIVDDHEVVREGLRLSLSRSPNIRVVGEAADGESAVALA